MYECKCKHNALVCLSRTLLRSKAEAAIESLPVPELCPHPMAMETIVFALCTLKKNVNSLCRDEVFKPTAESVNDIVSFFYVLKKTNQQTKRTKK